MYMYMVCVYIVHCEFVALHSMLRFCILVLFIFIRQIQRDIARPKPQPKVVEEPDAGEQQLTDEERRQKVRLSRNTTYSLNYFVT